MAVKKIKLPNNTTVDINDARDVVIGDGVENVVALTTVEYEALSTKDPNTTYILTDDTSVAENVANKATSISSSSTHTLYPAAKCVYDEVIVRPKYYLCASEAEYSSIATKDSATLYLIPKT